MDFKLTDEQELIIDSVPKFNSIKIEALAGTAKTFTLTKIAEKYNNKSFLYLAFNNSVVKDVKERMPDNVDCLTIHGLAFKYTRQTLNLFKRKIRNNFRIIEIRDYLQCRTYEEATVTKELFDLFCISKYYDINEKIIEKLLQDKKYLVPKIIANKINLSKIANNIKILWDAIYSNKIDMPHNFYLKFFHLNIKYFAKYIKYDYVLCDEFQDSNHIIVDIVTSLSCNKIYVGDIFQSIYQWNQAINAIKFIEAEKIFHLTYTFRCNEKITNNANKILTNICGYNKKLIPYYPDRNDEIKVKCFITRTNSSLIELLDIYKNKKIKTIRHPSNIFDLPLSLYYFSLNPYQHKDKITAKWLFSFKSINDIESYAKMNNDIELLSALKIVEKYDYKLIDLYNLAVKQYRKRKIDIYLTSAHTSKGLEFDEVTIWNDFPDILTNIVLKHNIKNLDELYKIIEQNNEYDKTLEEINLYYVALTRPKYKINDFTVNKPILIDKTIDEINDTISTIKAKHRYRI